MSKLISWNIYTELIEFPSELVIDRDAWRLKLTKGVHPSFLPSKVLYKVTKGARIT